MFKNIFKKLNDDAINDVTLIFTYNTSLSMFMQIKFQPNQNCTSVDKGLSL